MTDTNRRQLARVRNAFLGATALVSVATLATPASAIVINDNFTPTQAVDPTNITGVGQMVIDLQNGFIGLCTASLINPRTVIFASHCVNENPAGNAFEPGTGYGAKFGRLPIGFFFNANNNQAGNSAIGHWLNGVAGGPKDLTRTAENAYNSNFVVYNTNCCTIGLGNNFLQSDVAMAALDTPAIGIPTFTLLFTALAAPAHVTITGYGDNGIGTTGQGTIDFKRRVAENIVSVLGSLDDQDKFLFGAPDGLPANLYMTDFNDPKFNTAQANVFDFNIFHDTATTHEGITAPGDSGGPLIVDHQFGAPTIAAVLSGGDRFFNAQPGSSYGTTSFYQPLYLYWDWIVANNPYKYVGNKAGSGAWTDATHWQMNLDPAYMTTNAAGQLVNGLPTTKAQGQADVPPGFGFVCYFDDCINIATGAHTNPTPAPGPNPTGATGPFGGLLGQAGFDALVQQYAANGGKPGGIVQGGPDVVSASLIDGSPSADPAIVPGGTASTPGIAPGGSILSPDSSPQSDWTNPEGSTQIGTAATGELVQGAPGTTLTVAPNDTDGNPATGAPARYYDVTLAATGITTLSGAAITVDKLTINGPNTGLTIASGASLTSLITVNSFAGTTEVDGVLNSANGVSMLGGVLTGTGTVNAAGGIGFLLGAISGGTVGTIGTITLNAPVVLGIGSTTIIDATGLSHNADLIKINGTAVAGGTVVVQAVGQPIEMTDSYTFLTATGGITGAYNSVDTLAGVLRPVVTKVTVAGLDTEVVSFVADTFVGQLGGAGTADQIAVAGGLDSARGAHYNDLLALYQAIDPLSGNTLGQALENLAPDAERTATLTGDMVTTSYDAMLWQELSSVGGSGATQTAGLTVNGDGLKSALSQANAGSFQSQQLLAFGANIATNPGGGNSAIATTGTAAATAPAAAEGLWLPGGAGGFLTGSALQGSVSVGGGGGRADVRGMVLGAGLDMPVGNGFTLGVSFGYSDVSAVLRSAPNSLQSNSIQGALYGRYDLSDNWVAEAFGSYGHQTMTTHRFVIIGGSGFTLTGHTGGDVPSAGAYVGRSFHLDTLNGAPLTLTPNFSLSYLNSEVDPFTETGGAPALTFGGWSESSFASRLGLDAKMAFELEGIRLLPNLHVAWVDNFEGDNSSIQAAFAGAPGSVMTFAMAARDRSYGEMGVGLDADLGDLFGTEATLSARYDGNTRDDVQYGAWTGRLSIKF
jgi:uncharacterized protein with beta-barrel porin domain